MRRGLVLIALACCVHPAHIDPARFAARPEWTPAAYALPPGPAPAVDPAAPLDRDDAIEDLAYLDHALDGAWPEAEDPTGMAPRAYAHDAPLTAHTPRALCDELAAQYHATALRFAIGGRPCVYAHVSSAPLEPLAAVAAGKNYALRVDGDVAILAIARFVDPADPGWDGFADALRDLATRELVLLDLQDARGDDPRMGFALVTALGRDDVSNAGWRAPQIVDGPYAQVARANRAAHGPAPRPPRDRALWASFARPDDVATIARTLAAPAHDPDHRLVMLEVLVGPGCERACGLIAAITQFAGGAPAPRVDVLGGRTADASADEDGLVRLPHSGIEVTFPTAVYGPSFGRGELGGGVQPGFARAALAQLHTTADARAQERAFDAQPLPACSALPRAAPGTKLTGCPPDAPPAGAMELMLEIALDEAHTRAFLATCPDLTFSFAIHDDLYGMTIVNITAPAPTLERLASAPFVRALERSCPVELD